jgi:hypothetical protein
MQAISFLTRKTGFGGGRGKTSISQLTYINGVRDKKLDNTYEKWALSDEDVYGVPDSGIGPSYKLSFSIEATVREKEPTYELVRGKLRYSIAPGGESQGSMPDATPVASRSSPSPRATPVAHLTNWRIDITLVKTLTGTAAQDIAKLKEMRDILFPVELNVNNFTSTASWNAADGIEIGWNIPIQTRFRGR